MNGSLRRLGLTEYESKAYCALLKFGTLDGKQASQRSLVPYSTIHFVLQQLVHKNFAVMVSKKPMLFKAIKPQIAIASLIKEKASELSELKEDAIKELSELKKQPLEEEEERVEISAGRQQRFANAAELTQEVKKEKLLITSADTMPVDLLKANTALARRGANCRVIATQLNEQNKQLLGQLRKSGWKIRHYAPLSGFSLVVFDRKISLLIVMDPKNNEAVYNLKLNSKELAKAHAEYFDYIWKKAKQI